MTNLWAIKRDHVNDVMHTTRTSDIVPMLYSSLTQANKTCASLNEHRKYHVNFDKEDFRKTSVNSSWPRTLEQLEDVIQYHSNKRTYEIECGPWSVIPVEVKQID